MKEFMYLFRGGDARSDSQSPEAIQQHMQKWMNWMQDLTQKGKFVSGQPLEAGGMTITGAKMDRVEGAFAEGKEKVGGYLVVKAADLNEAVLLSKECPIFEYNGIVEVRPIQLMEM